MNTVVLGICGQMGAGKDTVASYLVKQHNYQQLSIAGPMKEFLKDVFHFTQDQLYGESYKRNAIDHRCLAQEYWTCTRTRFSLYSKNFAHKIYPQDTEFALNSLTTWFAHITQNQHETLTPRHCLQTLGCDWGQSLDKNIWVDYTLTYINLHLNHKFVISDVRFSHEINKVADFGGKLIRLERDINSLDPHISEKELLEVPSEHFAAIISNNQDKHHLYNTLDIIVPALERSCHASFQLRHLT